MPCHFCRRSKKPYIHSLLSNNPRLLEILKVRRIQHDFDEFSSENDDDIAAKRKGFEERMAGQAERMNLEIEMRTRELQVREYSRVRLGQGKFIAQRQCTHLFLFDFDNHSQRNKEEKRKEFDEDEDRAREEEGGAPTEMMEQHGKG